jgi:hypothetical protein
MSKPNSTISASLSTRLDAPAPKNIFNFNTIVGGEERQVKISPVETSSFHTVDFRDPQYADAILYSTSLTACAVVLIKNFNEETEKYDNVVTMAHFYPANAQNTPAAVENLGKAFTDFERNGGSFSEKTSVTIIGGALAPGEKIEDTTPLGPLLDAIVVAQQDMVAQGKNPFKFTHHKTSLNHGGMMVYPMESCAVFVNQSGTAITKSETSRDRRRTNALLTPEKEGMPLSLLNDINSCSSDFYPRNIREFQDRRIEQIGRLVTTSDRTPNMSSSESILDQQQRLEAALASRGSK